MTLSVMIFPLAKVVFLMLTPLVGVASLVPFSEKYSTRAMAEWLLLPSAKVSSGKVHPDVISVISMLKNEGFEVPEINMSAYMKARAMTQEFIIN